MYRIEAPEPIAGVQLRKILSQLDRFLDNIDQISLEDPKYNDLRTQGLVIKGAAERMIHIARQEDARIGTAVQPTMIDTPEVMDLSDLIIKEAS